MTKGSNVTEEQCETRNGKAHERIDDVAEDVHKIKGGIVAIAFFFAMVASVVCYHVNYRFSNIETTLEKIEKSIIPNVARK